MAVSNDGFERLQVYAVEDERHLHRPILDGAVDAGSDEREMFRD